GDDRDVYLQHVSASGNAAPGWPASGIDLSPVSGSQVDPHLLADGSGGCIASWDDARDAAMGSDIFAQRITTAGAVVPVWRAGGCAWERPRAPGRAAREPRPGHDHVRSAGAAGTGELQGAPRTIRTRGLEERVDREVVADAEELSAPAIDCCA